MKKYLCVLFLILLQTVLFGASYKKQISELYLATETASFNLELLNETNEFEKVASMQLELAILGVNPGLFKEDFFNLAFYTLAREKKEYKTAIKALLAEVDKETFLPLKKWIQQCIVEVNDLLLGKPDKDYSIKKDFDSLLKILP